MTDYGRQLIPDEEPGRANRKARRYNAEIKRLRAAGYTYEAIRTALFKAGVVVSAATIRRECLHGGSARDSARRSRAGIPAAPVGPESFPALQHGRRRAPPVDGEASSSFRIADDLISRLVANKTSGIRRPTPGQANHPKSRAGPEHVEFERLLDDFFARAGPADLGSGTACEDRTTETTRNAVELAFIDSALAALQAAGQPRPGAAESAVVRLARVVAAVLTLCLLAIGLTDGILSHVLD